jgi:hypothetical protein
LTCIKVVAVFTLGRWQMQWPGRRGLVFSSLNFQVLPVGPDERREIISLPGTLAYRLTHNAFLLPQGEQKRVPIKMSNSTD